MSGGVMPDTNPFRGTRMAEVADERADARIKRFNDFHAISNEGVADSASATQPEDAAEDNKNPYQEKLDRTRAHVAELDQRKTELSEQIKELEEQYRKATDRTRDANVEVSRYKRLISEKEYHRDNRGFLAKTFKPNEGLDKIQIWTEELAFAEQVYDNHEAHRAELEEHIDKLRQEQRDVNAEYVKADEIMRGVESLHFSYELMGGWILAERLQTQRERSGGHFEHDNGMAWDMADTYDKGDDMTL